MAKAKQTTEQKVLATLKEHSGHIIFALLGAYLILVGISMVEDVVWKAQNGLPNHDWSLYGKVWTFGTIIFGSMVLGGVLAQAALIRGRRKGKNG